MGITVNKDARKKRIDEQYKIALAQVQKFADDGYDHFTICIKGEWEVSHAVMSRLEEEHGVQVCERGFYTYGTGDSAYANVKSFIRS